MTVITKDGEKALKALEKKRQDGLKKLEDEFKKNKQTIVGKWNKKGRFDKIKFWGKSKTGDVKDVKYWALVNVTALQNFVKYGANKVMDQIRVRTHANIKAREEIERVKAEAKGGFDAKSFAFSAILVVMAAAIAFILVSNFFNYKVVQDDNIVLSQKVGQISGQLAACSTELAAYKPGGVPEPQQQDNTLEG